MKLGRDVYYRGIFVHWKSKFVELIVMFCPWT
jgi:hypothetical protein